VGNDLIHRLQQDPASGNQHHQLLIPPTLLAELPNKRALIISIIEPIRRYRSSSCEHHAERKNLTFQLYGLFSGFFIPLPHSLTMFLWRSIFSLKCRRAADTIVGTDAGNLCFVVSMP
jgi:hypothetical protein